MPECPNANAPGTIDPGYRGEIKIILLNSTAQAYTVHAGDRIAQMVIARYESIEWQETVARVAKLALPFLGSALDDEESPARWLPRSLRLQRAHRYAQAD